MPVKLTVEQGKLVSLVKKLADEADGKKLRLELAAGLRAAVRPAVDEVKSGAMRIKRAGSVAKRPTKKHPVAESDISLGAAIARSIGVRTRMSGRLAGVAVRASKKGMPRAFSNAPKRINSKHFRHKVFGHDDRWVEQVGAPGFFDDPLRKGRSKYRAECVKVMNRMAERIAK